MKHSKTSAFLGAAALTVTLIASAPAYSATVGPIDCSPSAGVNGSTEGDGQGTYMPTVSFDHCGTLGVRVQYSHVGGYSWTGWTYSSFGGASIWQNVGNTAMRSQHSATVGSLLFDSYR